MQSTGPNSPEVLAVLDRGGGVPLHRQLERALREHIRSGRLRPGDRLPSTRTLAADLGVGRGVVTEAFAQLVAEGRLTANRGAGTTVAPRAEGGIPAPTAAAARRTPTGPRADRATAPLEGAPPAATPVRFDFRLGIPDLSLFPRRAWLAAYRRAVTELADADLGYGDPAGLPDLRSQLAAYLNRARAAAATEATTLVTSGTVQSLALVCRVLSERGAHRIAVEEPGWPAQRAAVANAGLEAVPLAVDAGGAVVDDLGRLAVDAVLLTPAHQFPTGAVLDPERRLRLAAWAERTGGWLVEDDYDAEYRYDRAAPGCIQGLSPARAVYAGTASKTLAPALRLGWIVAPPSLAEPLALAKADADRCSSPIAQRAFAHFLAAGELDRHLRRTRPIYRERRAALLDALAEHLPQLRPVGIAAGLHAVVDLPAEVDERAVVAAAGRRGVSLFGTGGYGSRHGGLLLGYGSLAADRISAGIAELAGAVAEATITSEVIDGRRAAT